MFTESKPLSEIVKCSFDEFLENSVSPTYEEFKYHLYEELKSCPEEWRLGQKIYNTIYKYLPAEAQRAAIPFDCFYRNENIEDFLKGVYSIWKGHK